MPVNKIFIPTFISSVTYAPARVLPHIYFYNGLKACEPYYFQGYSNGNTGSVVSNERQSFPYFDNYEGQDPTSGSRSLLFFNEPAVYGTTPTGSLYTDYWANYINLLYNPRTRLVACEAIIPLADYFKMELNDIVEWRGNYYHLRAINDYNLSNGECKLQLLGPILGDVLPDIIPSIACDFDYTITQITTTTTTTTPPDCTGCREYTMLATGSGADVDFYWVDCNGNLQSVLGLGDGDILSVCSQVSGSYPSYTENSGSGILSLCGNLCSSSCECSDMNTIIGKYSYYSCIDNSVPIFGEFFTNDVVPCVNSNLPFIGMTISGSNSDQFCSCPTTTTTTSTTTTTTTTTAAYNLFGNCGRGDTVGEACSDAVDNARNFYSDCNSMTFGGGCTVYTDTIGTILTGYTRIFMNGSNWDISSTTGVVSGPSSTQC